MSRHLGKPGRTFLTALSSCCTRRSSSCSTALADKFASEQSQCFLSSSHILKSVALIAVDKKLSETCDAPRSHRRAARHKCDRHKQTARREVLRRPAWCCCPAAPSPWLPAHAAGSAAAVPARPSLPLLAAAAGPAAARCCLLLPARIGSDTLGAERNLMFYPWWEQGCVPQIILSKPHFASSVAHTRSNLDIIIWPSS